MYKPKRYRKQQEHEVCTVSECWINSKSFFKTDFATLFSLECCGTKGEISDKKLKNLCIERRKWGLEMKYVMDLKFMSIRKFNS